MFVVQNCWEEGVFFYKEIALQILPIKIMFIKNQTFSDEETLLEILFDFDLGTSSEIINNKRQSIEDDLKNHTEYHHYLATLTDEEERQEVATEERYIRLAESLMEDYDLFKTEGGKLYGLKNNQKDLLSELPEG